MPASITVPVPIDRPVGLACDQVERAPLPYRPDSWSLVRCEKSCLCRERGNWDHPARLQALRRGDPRRGGHVAGRTRLEGRVFRGAAAALSDLLERRVGSGPRVQAVLVVRPPAVPRGCPRSSCLAGPAAKGDAGRRGDPLPRSQPTHRPRLDGTTSAPPQSSEIRCDALRSGARNQYRIQYRVHTSSPCEATEIAAEADTSRSFPREQRRSRTYPAWLLTRKQLRSVGPEGAAEVQLRRKVDPSGASRSRKRVGGPVRRAGVRGTLRTPPCLDGGGHPRGAAGTVRFQPDPGDVHVYASRGCADAREIDGAGGAAPLVAGRRRVKSGRGQIETEALRRAYGPRRRRTSSGVDTEANFRLGGEASGGWARGPRRGRAIG